jgi:hypothetical protein
MTFFSAFKCLFSARRHQLVSFSDDSFCFSARGRGPAVHTPGFRACSQLHVHGTAPFRFSFRISPPLVLSRRGGTRLGFPIHFPIPSFDISNLISSLGHIPSNLSANLHHASLLPFLRLPWHASLFVVWSSGVSFSVAIDATVSFGQWMPLSRLAWLAFALASAV